MFEERKQKGKGNQSTSMVTTAAPRLPAAPPLQRQQPTQADQAIGVINAHTWRPIQGQQRVLQPVQRALSLHAEEVSRVDGERAALQRQIAEHPPVTTADIQQALQRQAIAIQPVPIVRHPQTTGDWVTVMRQQAEQAEGRRMGSKEVMQFTALQRQVAGTLVQSFQQDRQPAVQRYAEYADHLVSLQRHPISGQVAHAVLTMIPQGERPALQRAVDERLEQEAVQRQQDEQALQLHSLQRQLAEVNAEGATPVFERIQARRGTGNPLPEAVQLHLEQGLNHDLSGVRIHDDAEADKLARKVNAIAFTTGTDIFFQSGKYEPNSQSGLELLAHEVTHTVQQAKGNVPKGIDGDAGLEAEARTKGRELANKKFAVGPLKAKSLPKLTSLSTKAAVQRLQAKPQMTWSELQGLLKAKLLSRLSQNVTQLKTETTKYQTTGATPQWQHLLNLIKKDRAVQAQQQQLIKGIHQKFPQGLAGLPFPAKLTGHAATPDPTYWFTYIETVKKQLGSHSGPYVEAMRQLAASEGLRAAAHKTFPALSALATTGTPLEAGKTPQLLGEIKGQFAKTTDAIGKLKGEVQGGKIPWKYTDFVVQDIFREYGVKAEAPAMQAYQQAMKSEQVSQAVAMLLTIGVSVAALVAGGPVGLALGVVAAASGTGQAYLQTQDVRKQLEVSEAGRFGQNLTSVQVDAAQFQLAMGYLNTALSVIDVAAVAKVVALTSGSVLVGRGMVSLEKMLAEQGGMTPQAIPLGADSAGGRIATSTSQANLPTNTVAKSTTTRTPSGRIRVNTVPEDLKPLSLVNGKIPAPASNVKGVARQVLLARYCDNWTKIQPYIRTKAGADNVPDGYHYLVTKLSDGKTLKLAFRATSESGSVPKLRADENGYWQPDGLSFSNGKLDRDYRVAQQSEYNANNPPPLPRSGLTENHHLWPDNFMRRNAFFQEGFKRGLIPPDRSSNMLTLANSKEALATLRRTFPNLTFNDILHATSHFQYDSLVARWYAKEYPELLKAVGAKPGTLPKQLTDEQITKMTRLFDQILQDHFKNPPEELLLILKDDSLSENKTPEAARET